MSKKILLITLLFATITFGQYVAPNEDTVVVVGGLGTQADKNSLNGGGATKVAWDAGSPSDFIGTNGGTITADTAVTYSNGTTTFSKTGIGTGVTVGTLAYVSGTNITAGIYEITARTNDTIVCANIVAVGDNTDSVVNVGGALDGLQNALDNSVNDATGYSRYIYDNIATETITATIDVDTNSGSATTFVHIIGYNSTLAAEANITIYTTTVLVNGLVEFVVATTYTLWKNIIFDANGRGANSADHCILQDDNIAGSAGHVFIDCRFTDADDTNIRFGGDTGAAKPLVLIGCEIDLADSHGIEGVHSARSGSWVMGCRVHDNVGSGIWQGSTNGAVIGCLIYDNGLNGIITGSSCVDLEIIGNTFFSNGGNDIELNASTSRALIINNACRNSGGYSYKLNGASVRYFGYNLSHNPVTAHTDAVADADFADYFGGNNLITDPLFTSETDGSEDFTPQSGSPLIDAALDAGTN